MVEPITTDHAGGWRVPTAPRITVDRHYVMAAAGLLAPEHPDAARELITSALIEV
jgi:hypothetical protein